MSAQMIVELPGGQQILFGGAGTGTGLAEVGMAEDIAKASCEAFKSALNALGGFVKSLEESVATMPKRPAKIEMEFGVTLAAEGKLWIMSGKGDYAIKVKLSWDRSSSAAEP